MKHVMRIAPFLMVGALIGACGGEGGIGGDKSCSELCTEAQAGSCTSITGNCGNFCTSLDAVDGPAGCATQNEAYQTCLNREATVCGGSCSAQETTLSNCIAVYCATRTTDPNCQVLLQSF